MAPPAGFDLNGITGRLSRNGKEELSGKTDDPMGALAWVANLAAERGRPLKAGMVVITGSVVPTIDIGIGDSRWPTFNVADMAVSIGAFLLAWVLWGEDTESESVGVATPATEPRSPRSGGLSPS